MKKENKCFCQNKKCTNQFHKYIKSNSKYAKVFKLYSKIDNNIKHDISRLNLKPKCGKGCSECCHQIFGISEVDFSIIVDYLLEHSKTQINNIFEKSCEINDYIKYTDPIYYNKLKSNITDGNPVDWLNSSMPTIKNVIPEGCVFLNNNNECSIYKVRPVICRTHGVAYCRKEESNKLCSKLEISNENRDEFVDLTAYENEINSLFSFKYERKMTLRRLYPIFYWFCMLKEDNLDLYKFRKTILYNRCASLSESEMAEDLLKAYGNLS